MSGADIRRRFEVSNSAGGLDDLEVGTRGQIEGGRCFFEEVLG